MKYQCKLVIEKYASSGYTSSALDASIDWNSFTQYCNSKMYGEVTP